MERTDCSGKMTQECNMKKEEKLPAEEVGEITQIVVRIINMVWVTVFALPTTWPSRNCILYLS
jgi:hypothetical protein